MSIKKHLYRNKIEEAIKAFAPEGANVRCKKLTKNVMQFIVSFKDKSILPAMLIIYNNNDGTTTIDAGQGKNKDFSAKWAEFVVNTTEAVLYDTSNLYFDSISDDQFRDFVDYMAECKTVYTTTAVKNGDKYTFCGEYGETLYATKYDNGAILFQGHPSITFNNAISILADIYPSDEILVGLTKYYKLDFKKDDLQGELMNVCPNIVGKLSDDIINAMLPSIGLRRAIPDGLTDYSYLCFPVLRGIEGILKTIFRDKSVPMSAKSHFGGKLKYDEATHVASIEPGADALFTDADERNRIEKLYALLCQQRHRIFHFDSLTPILLSKNDALDILDQTLKTINDAY